MGDTPHQKCLYCQNSKNKQTKKLKTVKTFCTNKLTSFLTICNISALAKATPLGEPSILSTLLFSLLDGIKMDVPVSVLMRFTEKYKQKHVCSIAWFVFFSQTLERYHKQTAIWWSLQSYHCFHFCQWCVGDTYGQLRFLQSPWMLSVIWTTKAVVGEKSNTDSTDNNKFS